MGHGRSETGHSPCHAAQEWCTKQSSYTRSGASGTYTDSVDDDAGEVESAKPEKAESQEPDVQSEQTEQQEAVEAEPVKPEQEVISTDTQEAQGRSAFDIQFRKERGIT